MAKLEKFLWLNFFGESAIVEESLGKIGNSSKVIDWPKKSKSKFYPKRLTVNLYYNCTQNFYSLIVFYSLPIY